jgi:uncharacterized membrane protein YcaP (DUF421 family)
MIDQAFDLCVLLLMGLAALTGMSYKEINVWIFCVALPLVLLGQTAIIGYLLLRRR